MAKQQNGTDRDSARSSGLDFGPVFVPPVADASRRGRDSSCNGRSEMSLISKPLNAYVLQRCLKVL